VKNPNRHSLVILVLLLTLGSLPAAYGQITPSADAYTNTAAPTTNYGAKTLLDVDGASQITYIQFNLASVPVSASISKAALKLYVNSVSTAGSFNIDYVNGAWTEGTIDSSNAPPLGASIASNISVTTSAKNQYILVDITSALQAWLSGSEANNGIALVANGSFNATFDSKENTTTSHAPELDIAFAGGDGTITGVTTASGSGLQGGGTSGTLNLSLTTNCASGQILVWNGSAWACQTLKGGGTVTSVGLNAPSSDFTVTGSPVTSSGTLGLNWTVAPTSNNSANAIVKRDSGGSFIANNVTATGFLSSAAGAEILGSVGIGTGSPQAELNLNYNNQANSDTLLVGNSSSKGLRLRDTGVAVDLESIGVPLYTNWITQQPTYFGGLVGIGTAGPQAELNLNYGAAASYDTLLIGNNTSKGLQMRDNGSGVDLESIGVPLYVNFLTQQQINMGPAPDPSSLAALNVGAIHSVIAGHDYYNSAEFSNDVYVDGNLVVDGGLLVAGTKNFHIDHPLDPTNKYLNHASIESSEVLNQYSGNVVLDARGEARVEFPAWFGAINDDFRYQLTAIGAPGPNLYIAEKVRDNSFKIAGGMPGMEVSWLVTARRNDPYMRAHPYVVEQDKPERERGYYTDPSLYGAPKEQGILSKGQITAKKK
jgi:hypothetical protein